jgi:hypothetical protein
VAVQEGLSYGDDARADARTGYRSYWFYFFGFIFLLALGRRTELLSLDRSKIESMFKEIQAIRSKVPSKE